MTGDAGPAAPLVRLAGVHKSFGAVRALDGADLTLRAGRVHGVLGENGAGKTTLLEVLGGLVRPDGGRIEIGGRPVDLPTPRAAWREGVGLVHQHFTLVPALTVLENLALGRRDGGAGLGLPLGRLRHEALALAERTGLDVPLNAPVADLGVGERQRVEVLKVLLRRPRVLVLDEPTAVLAPPEVERLFGLLRELSAEGTAVALVAHKLDEVLGVADAVTVLRDGRTVLEADRGDVDVAALTRAMVGSDGAELAAEVRTVEAAGERRRIGGPVPGDAARSEGGASAPKARSGSPPDDVVARVDGASVRGESGAPAVVDATLAVRRGEIVGVAGVEGNGQRQLALLLAGRRAPDAGTVELPREVAFVPQDRVGQGLVGDFDLVENVALALHRRPAFRRGPLLAWGRLRAETAALMERFDVRAPGPGARARTLSGGNQQRVVVARELALATELLVAENPTRGLDVTAAAFVHRTLLERSAGPEATGVVLISTDLDEVLALSDRIFVMTRGRLLPVPPGEGTREAVGALMLAAGSERADA